MAVEGLIGPFSWYLDALTPQIYHHVPPVQAMTGLGHFRPGRGQQQVRHVGCARESGSKIRVFAFSLDRP
jgi:hypothetical protein